MRTSETGHCRVLLFFSFLFLFGLSPTYLRLSSTAYDRRCWRNIVMTQAISPGLNSICISLAHWLLASISNNHSVWSSLSLFPSIPAQSQSLRDNKSREESACVPEEDGQRNSSTTVLTFKLPKDDEILKPRTR
ncbi:uncharacterized protein EI97DRAFT_41316 [Westerdykella ornata]|uniref:Uncharacterized protein n=1 Tax=Westerdykella ornata TaxID=318751 RepID=A0A6A6JKL0_WESOR|nr:uncharacterized protein EI97DRAFT_41316 [Westerdykella ornata]KAF2276488.1 hypothetical protein EI97DRAFT_41316 [Westerdykella ornata]